MTENTSLPSGLRCILLPENIAPVNLTPNPFTREVLKSSEFRPWSDFPSSISMARNFMNAQLSHQGCRSDNRVSGRCSGSFRNEACGDRVCRAIAGYKARTSNSAAPLSERNLEEAFGKYFLSGITQIAATGTPNWLGTPCHRNYLYLDKKFCGGSSDIKIRPTFSMRRPSESAPDVVILFWPPQSTHLLPSLTQQRKSHSALVSTYNEACTRITDRSNLPDHMRRISSLITGALFSRSGYACMCNHNRAIFAKVIPQKTSLGARPKHYVYISKEYRCDNRDGSVSDGLLAIILRAFHESKNSTQDQLHHHFSRIIFRTRGSEDSGAGSPSKKGKLKQK